MNRAGDELLARPAFTFDQHGAGTVRHLRQQLEHPLHGRAAADNVRERVAPLKLLAQLLHLAQVTKRLYPADDVPALVLQHGGRNADRYALAIRPQDVHGLVHHRPTRAMRPFQGAFSLADARPKDVAAMPAQGLRALHARDPLSRRVERRNPPVQINGEHTVGDRIEDDLISVRFGGLFHRLP